MNDVPNPPNQWQLLDCCLDDIEDAHYNETPVDLVDALKRAREQVKLCKATVRADLVAFDTECRKMQLRVEGILEGINAEEPLDVQPVRIQGEGDS